MTASLSDEQPSRWTAAVGEWAGGLTGALVSFSIAVPIGALTLAPLGPAFAGYGVAAGIVAAAAGGLVATGLGSSATMRSGPMTALCLFINTLVALLITLPGMRDAGAAGLPRVVGYAFLSIAVAGAIQVGFGMLKLGDAIKYVPRPVLAGFRNATAILIALAQVPAFLGLSQMATLRTLDTAAIRPVAIAVAVLTMASVALARRWRLGGVSLFIGLLAGTLAHYALGAQWGFDHAGGIVGPLPSLKDLAFAPRYLAGVADAGASSPAIAWLVLPTFSVALIASLLSLLALKGVEDVEHRRANGNRELVAQGVANIVSGLLGGAPLAGSPAVTLACHRAGAHTRWSALVSSCLLLLAFVLAGTTIESIPMAALAGVMMIIAFDLRDGEALAALARARRERVGAYDSIVDVGIIVAVLIASLLTNILVGVALGVVISIVVFVVKSSRKLVRRHGTLRTRRSLRQRSAEETALLARNGDDVALLELDGPIFFGTADQLARDIERLAPAARFVILDCTRVNAIDATGAHGVGQVARAMAKAKRRLIVASLPEQDARREALARACRGTAVAWFADGDRALEWCEERLLEAAGWKASGCELPLASLDFCRELDAGELALLGEILERETHAAGTVLFREGEPGDRLYLLARGSVTITVAAAARGDKRIVTFAPGVAFGELALLEGRPRSADATFESDAVVYALSRSALAALNERAPALVVKIYRALALMLADRLRSTTQELRLLASQ